MWGLIRRAVVCRPDVGVCFHLSIYLRRLRLRPAAAGSPEAPLSPRSAPDLICLTHAQAAPSGSGFGQLRLALQRLLSSPDLHCLRQPRAAASLRRPNQPLLGRAGRPHRPWSRHGPSPSSSHSPHSSWQESPSVMANALAPVWPKERGPTATLQLYPTAAATTLFTSAARACVRQVAGLAPQHL